MANKFYYLLTRKTKQKENGIVSNFVGKWLVIKKSKKLYMRFDV